ncbi:MULTISPECIES: type IVB secretion system protein IcmV [Legionella]|uniref:Type IV secretion protein IcmV n=1 Tax=Legionella septentrionalis TaxID=2498109 RepID=A0A433JLJ7_9GAMM|nr:MULTISPECIES: type IVB secretion system protein IcmV [Legionella]MCP0914583.1 type IVB secretion system protein IcmV [Legionella sp. 27cVA30]RUQ90042.1 type IV secretion protein IcmV [Legionella septentrionalis]RUQ95508.1 type IV secretion protein IcmV [Legionella septentrionalis]RUR11180.1 type IV secretion protein IcmV [Legionella septentrionalis]RUR14359.1 type IV secretion protein IcmV [Legionella septentrionalis]
MKKKFGSRTASVIKRIFNIRRWADWERIKGFTQYLAAGFRKLFIPQRGRRSESFEAAKARLRLTESELLARQNGLFRLSVLMFAIAIFLFLYAVYQLIFFNVLAFLLSFIVMLIAAVLAFRYHFWYFQIKKRKLGCTLNEWFRQGIMGENND